MIDIAFIRENADLVTTAAKNKNVNVDIIRLLELDEQRRGQIGAIEELRAKRNELSASSNGQRPTDEQIAAGTKLKEELTKLEADFDTIDKDYQEILLAVPNIPTDD